MEFSAAPSLKKRKQGGLLVIPFWKTEKGVSKSCDIAPLEKQVHLPLDLHDFKGNLGETLFLYPSGIPEKRVALLGLGKQKEVTLETLRRAFSSLTKECLSKKIVSLNLMIPTIEGIEEVDAVYAIAEGMLLANYQFDKLKGHSLKEESFSLIKSVSLIGASSKALKEAQKALSICEAVHFARDLVNGNADDITPQALAETAKSLAKKFKSIKVQTFDKKWITKEKMGLLLAVNKASPLEPAFIIAEYKGDPKSKDHTVIVGKGVTYDTGGLSLKPTSGMLDMKCDMSGAATALGTVLAAAKIGLKKNITAVVPSTENCIGSKSYKPGDVYRAYSGKTVEIDNTDAEGRLILADALAYACKKLKPSRIIDFATLTGAVVIALGEETTGLMSNNDELAAKLSKAGESTYERVWRLPLFDEYRPQLKSDIADIKNTGGREASSITAALFLKEFVEGCPWAHLDIAGTAHLSKPRRYHPKYGTGVGIRLMIKYLESE